MAAARQQSSVAACGLRPMQPGGPPTANPPGRGPPRPASANARAPGATARTARRSWASMLPG
eukprot:3151687-Lingulodinium_polyedra.AAC.1